MRRRSPRAFVTIAAALLAALALPTPARAAGELRIVVDASAPLFDLTKLAPGSVRQSSFTAANDSADDGVLRLRVVNLREHDRGCNRSEKAHGDVTCGDGGGELGRDLTVALVPLTANGAPAGPALFDGSIRDLVDWTMLDPRLPGLTERSFRLDWKLPVESPNDTQTDSVAFAMEFVLEQATVDAPNGSFPPGGQTAVEGETLNRPSPTGAPVGTLSDGPASERLIIGELPRTGLALGPLAALGGALSAAGWVGQAAARRRRQRAA